MLNPPRCPKCAFQLVFLERRLKYKCSLCRGVYLQKEIENKSFRNWNTFQRKQDIETLEQEIKSKKRIKLTPEERKLRVSKSIEEYGAKNREKLTLKAKLWRQKNRTNYNEWVRSYISKNKEKIRINARIRFWRKKQRELTLLYSENKEYKPLDNKITHSVPTFSLAEVLIKPQSIYISVVPNLI